MRGQDDQEEEQESITISIPHEEDLSELYVMEDWGLYALRGMEAEFVAHFSEEGTWHLHQVAPEVTGVWYYLNGVTIMAPATAESVSAGSPFPYSTGWGPNDLTYMGSTLAPLPKPFFQK